MIAAAVLALAMAAAQDPPEKRARLHDEPPSGPTEWYRKLVERYRTGDREAAVAEEFPPEKVLYEISTLARLVDAVKVCGSCPLRHELDTFSIEAAVLLHTDRALAMFDRYEPAAQAEMELAPRLIALMDDASRNAFEPRWLRAAALLVSKQGSWALALTLLDPGVRRYPGDAMLLLARGAVLESETRLTTLWQTAGAGRSRLVEAEKCYRQIGRASCRD